MAKTPDRFREFAQLGAEVRLGQLREEIAQIYKAFPALRFRKVTRHGPANPSSSADGPDAVPAATRRRRRLSAAQKKAISQRMKKYWADRKRG
jgi:hypothetical protein